MPSHPLTNFEIQILHQDEPKFNDVYSRNYLNDTKSKAYVANIVEVKSLGTRWIALYVNGDHVTCNNFGV